MTKVVALLEYLDRNLCEGLSVLSELADIDELQQCEEWNGDSRSTLLRARRAGHVGEQMPQPIHETAEQFGNQIRPLELEGICIDADEPATIDKVGRTSELIQYRENKPTRSGE